jgi:hypothetical protein
VGYCPLSANFTAVLNEFKGTFYCHGHRYPEASSPLLIISSKRWSQNRRFGEATEDERKLILEIKKRWYHLGTLISLTKFELLSELLKRAGGRKSYNFKKENDRDLRFSPFNRGQLGAHTYA